MTRRSDRLRKNRRGHPSVLSWTSAPQSVTEFKSITTWCPDCPATATTLVIGQVGYVDVRHEPTCPAYTTMTTQRGNP